MALSGMFYAHTSTNCSVYSFFLEIYPTVFVTQVGQRFCSSGGFGNIWQHNIPFRFCGLMFLFIPLGMPLALILCQRCTDLSSRLPLPGIVPKGQALTSAENGLVLVLPAWYATHSCQRCHDCIVILVLVVRNIEFITPFDASYPRWVERARTHWGSRGLYSAMP
jgi:hypothetical protein